MDAQEVRHAVECHVPHVPIDHPEDHDPYRGEDKDGYRTTSASTTGDGIGSVGTACDGVSCFVAST
jgi:hypothetical protein